MTPEFWAVVQSPGFSEDLDTSCPQTGSMSKCDIASAPRLISRLDDVFGVPHKVREIPYLTPPYLLNTPEIVVRDLHPASNEQLKFVVLATDGCKSLTAHRY